MSNDKRELTLSALTQLSQANHRGIIHGGEVMKMMDNAAGSLAMRYSKRSVLAARADQFQFLQQVHVSSYLTCRAKLAYVGNTSMEIYVAVDVEDLLSEEEPKRTTEGFFTMVAMDDDGKPTPVPAYTPETEEEIMLYEAVKTRRDEQRKERNIQKGIK